MAIPVCDCRNMDCPQPVLLAKKLVEAQRPESLEVLVDNEAARENVTRYLGGQGYIVQAMPEGDFWHVLGILNEEGASAPAAAAGLPGEPRQAAGRARTLVLISAPVFGSGDDALGIKLMRNFLLTLPEMGEALWRIILLNGGVKLATRESPVLTELRALGQAGVDVLVCGTCLEHFGIMDKKVLGETTNMLDVVTSIDLADKIVRV